jgi:putative heme-binding domain-containing protein
MNQCNFIIAVIMSVAPGIGLSTARAADWKPASIPATQPQGAAAGPTWYRCFIRVPSRMVAPAEKDLFRDSITLSLAGVRGPFTVYLNGQKIAEGADLPSGQRRRFKIPKGILEKDVFNALAIRIDPNGGAPGQAPILAEYFDELLLDGTWQVSHGEIEPASLKPLAKQPETAFYLETGFKPATSPLGRNSEFMPGLRVPPAESLAKLKPADDLVIDLIASEPAVAQPTHISFDERGRMWVAQYRQYPYPAGLKMVSRDMYYRARFDKIPPPPPNQDKGADIITVHEDTQGNGVFDKHKVVLDGLNMANSVLRGHGGIWVMNTPYLMFYPDANGDDVPDRAPEVRLAGFGLEDTHSVANGLAWGPDGWLYGGQGSTTTSRIVRPGIDPPNSPGVYFEGCMVWRYHPEKNIYEIFAEGGGNTFGLDFDSEGRLYSGHNGGITHGFYFVQGGLYLKQGLDVGKFGPPSNPFAFGVLPAIKSRNPIPRFTHDIIMFEGTALPPQYVGRMFSADPLHHCLTLSERYPVGSTFETSDSGTPLKSDDITFRPVYLTNAPDGAIYIADFCEEFIAHGQNYQGQIDPTSGRIYRLRGKNLPLDKDVNLAAKTTLQLIKTLGHPNRWHRQTAVRVLAERHDLGIVPALKDLLKDQSEHPTLEAVWTLHQLRELDAATAVQALAHPAGAVRAWAVRLMGDCGELPAPMLDATQKHIAGETDPEVRAQIAATARRLPPAQGLALVSAILARDADADDAYVPMLCWWTIESHCEAHRDMVMAMFKEPAAWESQMMKRQILPRLMRRLAVTGLRGEQLDCARLLEMAPTAEHRKLLIEGFEDAFKGRAMPSLPIELVTALARSGQASPLLRARIGEPDAIAAALKIAGDAKSQEEDRLSCVTLFGEVKVPQAVPLLMSIAGSPGKDGLRKAAVTALLLYDDDTIGSEIAALYSNLPPTIQPAAMNLLASRATWSAALLKLIENGTIKSTDVPVDVVTRIRSRQDPAALAVIDRFFPNLKPLPKSARMAEVARVRAVIEAGSGNPYKGEATFMQRCAVCHTLFHKGGNVGPNLTSYQRDDLGTMLISIIDPSAEIREGFQNYILRTKDGRTLSGFLADNDAKVITLRGLDGQDTRVPRADIAELKALPTSIMPDGLLDGMKDQELRDFIAYLRIPQPISK